MLALLPLASEVAKTTTTSFISYPANTRRPRIFSVCVRVVDTNNCS